MKAIHLVSYGSAKQAFKEANVDIPILIDNEDVLIKVHAFGLNFADIMARKGLYRATPPLPAILGYEVIGEVIKVHDQSHDYLVGKRVLSLTRFGGYAEYVKSNISTIKEVPSIISDGQALALATQYCTAFLALESCSSLKKSDTILIHSASGGVGTAITQLAKLKELKVIGLTRSQNKVEYLKSNGVDIPIVTTNEDYFSKIKPEKIQASFNSVGGDTFKKDIQLLDIGGQIVFFGISDRTNQKKGLFFTLLQLFKIGKIHPAKLLLNSQSIQGLNLLALGDKNPQQLNNALEELISLMLENKIKPKANHEFNFNEIVDAHQGVEEGKFIGKVFVKV